MTSSPWIKKASVFLTASLLLGWGFGWASPRMFPEGAKFGFAHGLLHGAMMPLALPALLMGETVELFGSNNTGRGYKIGYIFGVNACGLIFFGSAFWRYGGLSSKRGAQCRETSHQEAPTD